MEVSRGETKKRSNIPLQALNGTSLQLGKPQKDQPQIPQNDKTYILEKIYNIFVRYKMTLEGLNM